MLSHHINIIKVLCFRIAIFLFFGLSEAQTQDLMDLKFDNLTSENIKIEKGLSQNTIHCILQDRSGYMWFGTWDGLNKYDGYSFTIYNRQTGLTGQTINTIFEDSEGELWAGTDNGLNRINNSSNEIAMYRHLESDTFCLIDDNVTSILEDKLGNLWIGTQRGLSMLERSSGRFYPFFHLPHDNTPLRSNAINDMCFDDRGFLWIATNVGLIRYDHTSRKVKRYYHLPDDPFSLPNNQVNSVLRDTKGNFWVGTQGGLAIFNRISQSFVPFYHDPADEKSLTDNRISVIFEDGQGYIWIGTDNGLNIYYPEEKVFTRLMHESDNQNSISNNRILSIYEDASSSIWVGTFIGVSRYDRYSSKFRHYKHLPDDPNCLNTNYIVSIFEDPDRVVWMATDKGINKLDRKTGKFSNIQHIPGDTNSLATNDIKVIIQDKNGYCWVGLSNLGLDRYNPDNGIFTHYRNNPKDQYSLSSNDVISILEDSQGYIWIGTETGGLNRYNPENGKFTAFLHDSSDEFSISSNYIWRIYEDSKGDIWVGTDNGINCFKREENRFYSYLADINDPESLSARDVFSIYEDQAHVFWIGTKGGGMNRFDPLTGKFRSYGEDEGLANNVVYATLEDDIGNLWISTNWGLSKFNIADETFINYDVIDGIQSHEFNLGADFLNNRGEMYFGGMNGFNLFHPSEIKINTRKPETIITTFSIFNQKTDFDLRGEVPVKLSAHDNFFTIEFSAMDYTNPAKNQYRYILEDYDKDWTLAHADKRYAEYTNVKPGTYLFRVKGSNNDGVWDEQGVSLTIIITPFWYNTWLFRSFLILLLIFALWYFISRRFRNIRKQYNVEKKVLKIEKQLFETELQALRLQMNPHFIFNTLNSIQSFILTNDTDKAVNYLGKFSQLMRQILANSRESHISVKEELKGLRYYMDIEKLRFDNKFDYSVSLDPKIDDEFMEIPPMVIQPYVENAIIHGLIHKEGRGQIDLNVNLVDDYMLWVIEDNGIGRAKAMKIREESGLHRKSRGMLITMERLEVLNKINKDQFSVDVIDLKDENGEAAGTRVELRISYSDG